MTKKILLFSMLLALGFATSCKEDMPPLTPEPTPVVPETPGTPAPPTNPTKPTPPVSPAEPTPSVPKPSDHRIATRMVVEPIKEKTGKKLTVTDIISIAVVRTLMNHPYINASLSADGSQIELHNYVNLAMAVGMDEGLLVPVVHGAEKLGLVDLMLRLKDITERAVGKKLMPQDQEGSTFTISNLGMYGVESFTSIINQPNSAILSIAGTKEMPVVRNGEVVIRPIMKMSLTSDHRVINGLGAAKFMQELKATLESPLPLLV